MKIVSENMPRPPRVLIVDDSADDADLLLRQLTRGGYEAQIACNGKEAMEIIRRGECRLVISDWNMPVMDGIQLCKTIRREDQPAYIYFILLKACGTPEEAVEGLNAGADDFISKSAHPAELMARIHAAERVLALETRDLTIFAMAKLAESRDLSTGEHLERVQEYSRTIAQTLMLLPNFTGLDAEYIRLMYLTSPLHDIGKVGIPDAVLLKPGRLNNEEFDIMKTHSMIGAQTLDATLHKFPGVKFLQMARDIAATHHERFNGSGYPQELRNRQIPLCGRIVALADVYDALTSKRVYKEAFGHDAARAMIIKESGMHFDPMIVDAFVKSEARFLFIKERFAEPRRAAA